MQLHYVYPCCDGPMSTILRQCFSICAYSCGIEALACTDLAILIEVLEMTSVWKKFAMLLRKGSAFAVTLPALSLKACTWQIACVDHRAGKD